MKTFKNILLIALLFCASQAQADWFHSSNETVHFTEHFVASGAIFSGVYLIMHDGLGLPQKGSFVAGACTALAIGLTYKLAESAAEGYLSPNFGHSMLYNAIGVAVPAVVLMGFDL